MGEGTVCVWCTVQVFGFGNEGPTSPKGCVHDHVGRVQNVSGSTNSVGNRSCCTLASTKTHRDRLIRRGAPSLKESKVARTMLLP